MKNGLKNTALVVIGCLLYALGFNLFFDPFRISPGGVSGIAMVISYYTGLPVGVGTIIMNIPLVIMAYIKLGKGFIIGTAAATALSSVMIDLTAWMPTPVDDIMLATLCGAVIIGTGVGMILRGGATTGGTEIVSKLLQYYKPHIKMGRILLVVDGLVVALTAVSFRDFSLAAYAFIGLFTGAHLVDTILYGFDAASLTYIISDRYDEIGEAIQTRMGRGVTYLEALGGYRKTEKRVILCAVKPSQISAVRRIVEEIDSSAFLIVTDGHQIFGDGFLPQNTQR